jgi:hypothetical protein
MNKTEMILIFIGFGILMFAILGYMAWIIRRDSLEEFDDYMESLRNDGVVLYDQDEDEFFDYEAGWPFKTTVSPFTEMGEAFKKFGEAFGKSKNNE